MFCVTIISASSFQFKLLRKIRDFAGAGVGVGVTGAGGDGLEKQTHLLVCSDTWGRACDGTEGTAPGDPDVSACVICRWEPHSASLLGQGSRQGFLGPARRLLCAASASETSLASCRTRTTICLPHCVYGTREAISYLKGNLSDVQAR